MTRHTALKPHACANKRAWLIMHALWTTATFIDAMNGYNTTVRNFQGASNMYADDLFVYTHTHTHTHTSHTHGIRLNTEGGEDATWIRAPVTGSPRVWLTEFSMDCWTSRSADRRLAGCGVHGLLVYTYICTQNTKEVAGYGCDIESIDLSQIRLQCYQIPHQQIAGLVFGDQSHY